MAEQPTLADRDELPYVSLPAVVTMEELAGAIDRGLPQLFGWLAAHGIAPAGPPLIRYNKIDMARVLEIELGVPVPAGTTGDEAVAVDVLPSGRYATLVHVGPYDELVAANAALQAWADDHGITFDSWPDDGGEVWRSRVEHYVTNPAEEPDPSRWQTDIAYLTVR